MICLLFLPSRYDLPFCLSFHGSIWRGSWNLDDKTLNLHLAFQLWRYQVISILATWSFVTHWNWVYFHITFQSLKILRNATCARLHFEMTVVRFVAGSHYLLHEYAILITVFQCNWFSLESNAFYFIPVKTFWEEVHRLWQTATKVRTPWLHHTFWCFDCLLRVQCTGLSQIGESGNRLLPWKIPGKGLMVWSEMLPTSCWRQKCESSWALEC